MKAFARRKSRPAQGLPGPGPKLTLVSSVEDAAIEAYLNRQTVEACLELRRERGEEFRRPKSKDQPHQTLDELDIMLSRGEITPQLYRAGRNYGDRYREGHAKGVYYSSLRQNTRSSTGDQYDEFFVKRMTVFVKLHRDRQRALGGNRRIIALCDAILGDDYRAGRDDRKQRERFVEIMSWALTRLAYHYGYMW